MIIYHGSNKIIKNPVYKGSDEHNDYGPAFYMTLDLDSAKSWACRNNKIGIVNKYIISDKLFKSFKILDLTNKEKYCVLNWIAILVHFKKLNPSFIKINKMTLDWLDKYYINVEEYDVIKGFRADDAYFRFPTKFITNDLSFEDLEETFLSGDLGIQYALISNKAISALSFIDIISCDKAFINHYYSLIRDASIKFDELLSKPKDPKKTYIFDLMRKDNE